MSLVTTQHIISKLCQTSILSIGLMTAYASAAQAKPFGIDHILQMKTPGDVHIDPSGKWVVYSVSRNDEDKDKLRTQIWMSAVDGSVTLPMTSDYANASSPQFSPDGKSLAFMGVRGSADEIKKEKPQVWLLDLRGGEAQQYTHVKQGVSNFSWSPDGDAMLLTIRDPKPEGEDKDGEEKSDKDAPKPWVLDRLQFKRDNVGYLDSRRSHFYIFDGTNDPVQITSGDYDDNNPEWSPDGTKIAFASKRDGDPDANSNSDIWLVSANPKARTHPLTQLTTNKGSDSNPSWSPDGKSIAYTTVREPEKLWYATRHLAVLNVASKTNRVLTKDYDRTISNPKFSNNGQSIYFLPNDGGNRPLMKVDVGSGTLSKIIGGDISVRGYDMHKSGAIATIKSTHNAPFDVHYLKGTTSRRISKLNDEMLDDVTFADVKRLKVKGYQGDLVESFVYYPTNYKKGRSYPTLFVLHGGPVSQHDSSFDAWGQLYAAHGYVAVLPNPHGSNGYGQNFSYALNRQWGVPDYADVDAIADHLVATGVSKSNKLGVGGWSYGGILTNYAITKSTRFAGAVTGASVVNSRANYGHDMYQNTWEVEFGLPWENIEAWEAINMFNDVGKITTPTLVMGGHVDWNVPIHNSEQLYQALKRRGIDTQLVVYPNEHHGIRRPSFIRDRYERYLDWYKKYVK